MTTPRRGSFHSLGLAALALANQLLFYAINVVLARQLSTEAFDRYCVAVSTTLILSTIATLGLEKYALRYLPPLLERGDAARVRAYWRFSLTTVVGTSLALIIVFAAGMFLSFWAAGADPRLVILYLVAFLPGIGLCCFTLEVVTASGTPLPAVAVYRVVLPGTLLSLIVVLWWTALPLSATTALLAYGTAWTVATFLLWRMARARLPFPVRATTATAEPRDWLRGALPFLLNSLLLTLLAQSGVVILAFVATSDAVVGQYAVAAQLGTFIVLLATSTNRGSALTLPPCKISNEPSSSTKAVRPPSTSQ